MIVGGFLIFLISFHSHVRAIVVDGYRQAIRQTVNPQYDSSDGGCVIVKYCDRSSRACDCARRQFHNNSSPLTSDFCRLLDIHISVQKGTY